MWVHVSDVLHCCVIYLPGPDPFDSQIRNTGVLVSKLLEYVRVDGQDHAEPSATRIARGSGLPAADSFQINTHTHTHTHTSSTWGESNSGA